MAPLFVYINGYSGVGKLTVAKRLATLLDNAKVFDNHLLIDRVAAIYDRSMPEYQPLRKEIRNAVLESIARSETTKDVKWIFTDQQSSSPIGSETSNDYYRAASTRQCPLISVILTCSLEENLRRLSTANRGGDSNTKLTDSEILRHIRESEDIYRFGGPPEMELDASEKSAEEVANDIKEFIDKLPL